MKHFPGLKHLFRAVGIFSLFIISNNVSAQTPIGKWTEVSSKQFLTEEGIKSYGRSVLETGMTTIGVVIYSFLADHTYQISSKSVRNPSPRIFKGTWTLGGNQLTMISNGVSVNSKMNIQDNVLTLDTAYPNSDITTNVIVTFKKS
jgi:hypothetical protein